MKKFPSDPVPTGGDAREGMGPAHEVDGQVLDLPDLVRQREEFAYDVTRIEAALARRAEGDPGLYERLLRCRRISGKLENRIQLVRLQQKMQVGK